MSIDNCQVCEKRLDTNYIEYQKDGSLYCDGCLDDMAAEQEPDWKAMAGELAEALKSLKWRLEDIAAMVIKRTDDEFSVPVLNLKSAIGVADSALAKYEQEKGV
jgi:hypothetical protein